MHDVKTKFIANIKHLTIINTIDIILPSNIRNEMI